MRFAPAALTETKPRSQQPMWVTWIEVDPRRSSQYHALKNAGSGPFRQWIVEFKEGVPVPGELLIPRPETKRRDLGSSSSLAQ